MSKNDVQHCLISDLVNLVMVLRGLMFNVYLFEADIMVLDFDYHKMNAFKFVRCSKNDV